MKLFAVLGALCALCQAAIGGNSNDAIVNAKLHGICRSC
jgi:hypothetical protein